MGFEMGMVTQGWIDLRTEWKAFSYSLLRLGLAWNLIFSTCPEGMYIVHRPMPCHGNRQWASLLFSGIVFKEVRTRLLSTNLFVSLQAAGSQAKSINWRQWQAWQPGNQAPTGMPENETTSGLLTSGTFHNIINWCQNDVVGATVEIPAPTEFLENETTS